MKALPLGKVYQLIEPGPVVMLTTAYRGRADIMTMSWHMMVDFEPPLIACVVREADYSLSAVRSTGECSSRKLLRQATRRQLSGNVSSDREAFLISEETSAGVVSSRCARNASSRCRSSIAAGNQTIFTDGIETAGSSGFPRS